MNTTEITTALNGAEVYQPEDQQPLMRELPPAAAFPMEALGKVLGDAAIAIHDLTQAPLAICGQSILAAATLAAQAHADVQLPRGGGRARPLSNFFVTVAKSGERKSSVDGLALIPVRNYERRLRAEYDSLNQNFAAQYTAWDELRKRTIKGGEKLGMGGLSEALRLHGAAPPPPLKPILICTDPTIEGLGKLLAEGQPSMGVFSAEGGTFVGGYGMSKDQRLKTAAAMSNLWDGTPIDRVRSQDGASILVGRRVSLHLMMQPGVAGGLLGDDGMVDQGFLSRVLVAAPDSTAGTRFELGRQISPNSQPALDRYTHVLQNLLEKPLPLASDKQNELDPPALVLAPTAQSKWLEYCDHIEGNINSDGELESVRGLACKMPEHAARLAGVLALIENRDAASINVNLMENAFALCDYYLAEALRLFGSASVSPETKLAEQARRWMLERWPEEHISLTDILQHGPTQIRENPTAQAVIALLTDYGHLMPVTQPVTIKGRRRRNAWRILGKRGKTL